MRLTQDDVGRISHELAEGDRDLARVLAAYGPPPLWGREPTFATLVHLILEQQVSLASAQATMNRLVDEIGTPTPDAVLSLDDAAMLAIGFSRQKRDYARGLAEHVGSGALDLEALEGLPDDEVRAALTALKGIGDWTADVYLLMALCRPDLWPIGDRALVVAARELLAWGGDPSPAEMLEIGERWRPWRSVAARLLWHFYLSEIRPPRRPAEGADP